MQSRPELLEAAQNNPSEFSRILQSLRSSIFPAQQTGNPLDVQSQEHIEAQIRQKNIEENLATAMEYHPESFGSVTMLYIPCCVNDYRLKAFVDCGAQTTISNHILRINTTVSERCAKRSGLDRLLDTRFAGVAKGVGTSRILGRVHSVQLEMGGLFLPCTITVIEGDGPDMLLGLDMLRRHQCCVDLGRNVLAVGGVDITFLPESEIPKD
jgi:DNA damage-inducible protein 1